jgi:ABC-type multidrug transport system fused ATPase/permease subunit
MATDPGTKQTVWKNIYRLVLPHKKKFLWVVTLCLLSTGANLIEPLIYREAINDVAGLFINQAKEETKKELGTQPAEGQELSAVEEGKASTRAKDTALLKKRAQKPVPPASSSRSKHKVKEPHSRSHVAPRSPEQALSTLLWAVGLLLFINLIATILWRVSENKNVRLSCLIEQRFIQGTFAHVLNLPLQFFGRRSSAAISKQIDQSEEVSAVVNGFSQQVLPELISLTGILAIMFYENIALTSVALIIIPFYLLVAWRSASRLESGLSAYYERWEEVSSRIQDALSGIKTVKLSGAETREVENLQLIADEAYRDYVDRSRLANKYVFWETMLTHLATALVLGYGGYLTLQNKLTPGDVVMFVTYLDRLYSPIDSLASLWVNLQQSVASIARAFRLLDYGVEEKAGQPLVIGHGRVEFRDVHFSYTSDREILKGISFTLEPGRVTALVGTSGAGKTTTVDLLLKLFDPASGTILIDGQDLSRLNAASVRSQIGLVSTDGSIFSGTLAENIRYKKPGAKLAAVEEAAARAGLETTLQRLPEGLSTVVGESGIGLSVGERQRVQIARVLLAHPRILVLDEATANLDFATEAEVKKTIEEIRKENTVLIIAHRYNMVRDADHVVVMSDGEVIDQGSPQELIAGEGWFAEFARSVEEEGEEEEGDEEINPNEEEDHREDE